MQQYSCLSSLYNILFLYHLILVPSLSLVTTCTTYLISNAQYYAILNNFSHCVVPESIHTVPMEGHWKFLGGRGVLQSSVSNHGHRTKFLISFWQVCDMFLPTLRWPPFKLANQNVSTGEGRVVTCHVGFPTIDNSACHRPCILIGQMQHQAIRKLIN